MATMDARSVADGLLSRLTDAQRAAATAPPGPVLCVAPAGSGKTTTLVARVAWRIAEGVPPSGICAVTFNRRAAEELSARIGAALAPLGIAPEAVRVRTFHALGLEILRSAGRAIRLADRDAVLRRLLGDAPPEDRMRVDTAISRLKLDAGLTAADVRAEAEPDALARLFLAYEDALDETGSLDFDDLVARSLRSLRADAQLLARWRGTCQELLVDEVQDVDRSQLDLALLLAGPSARIFLVGDDDQCIYAWRLADVRRVLSLADRLKDLRRVDLPTNFRCPAPVVERAVRLVEHNRERFAKRIEAGPEARGRLVLAPDGDGDPMRLGRVLRSWPPDGSTRAILARTNRELIPAIVAALEADQPFRCDRVALPLEDPSLDGFLAAAATTDPSLPLLRRLAAVVAEAGGRPDPSTPRSRDRDAPEADAPEADAPAPHERDGSTPGSHDPSALRRSLLAWAAPYHDLDGFAEAVGGARRRLLDLRQPDASLSLSTAHATKGLEFDHVAVLMDAHRFPNARSLSDAEDPARALEEERRLAYVAWTRARRSLTLVYDPTSPSRFLLEAFEPRELGVDGDTG
jgi:superfamily I DNA/RNA helicase